ncbi:rhodanese-like domain-containing protein [Geothrix fuzhouensis]|uniref:rhodanese-like domain-containing protein n=1 Tax=Geothrix fuzhouensis TaxID=2966451 RepID=UPI0021494F1C|nr:rhodanese-like domain-containing protein [Geothrix fuzhouensis]
MLRGSRSTSFRTLALAGLAVGAALLSNRLASPARRLAWAGSAVPLSPVSPGPAATPRPEGVRPEPVTQEPGRGHLPHSAPPTPPGKTPPPASVAPSTPEPPSFSPIREISSAEAWQAFHYGTPFLDARRGSEFAEGHIAGAWSTPVWESDLDDRLLSFKAARRPGSEDPIVIYCSGGDCRDSHLLAEKLLGEGYFHILIFRDGFPAWVAQGRPVEKGRP